MDLLYQRYSNPLDLVSLYINRGRFGEWVRSVVDAENERKKQEAEQRDEDLLWQLYLQIGRYTEESFLQFKDRLSTEANNGKQRIRKRDADMNDADIKDLMLRLFPNQFKNK